MNLTPTDVEKFIKETQVNQVNLDECFQKQSALRAYYGAEAARYDSFASKVKSVFEFKEAQLFKTYREKFIAEGVKPTEKMIENAVRLDPAWLKSKQAVIDAQCQADIARALVMSLIDRRDMLIQLGADRRDETKGQMRMMEMQQEQGRIDNIRRVASGLYSQSRS